MSKTGAMSYIDGSMSPTRERLGLRDVQRIFRLIGEIREVGDDPKVWRPRMVQRLCRLLGAALVISSEVHALTTRTPGKLRIIDIGWGCDSEGNVWEICAQRDDETLEEWRLMAGPMEPVAAPSAGAGEEKAGTAGEAMEVPVKPIKRVYGGTSFVLSQYRLPHINAVDQLGIHRAFGAEPFSAREHKLIRLFHKELGRLWKRDALRKVKDPTRDLPPRLGQTLAELVNGLSEKEIAAKLDLSPHTIHNYVKALHQRFEVSSRGELLAKVGVARRGDFTPRLSIEDKS